MTTPTPPTYADRAALADDATFKGRVKVALMTAAVMTALKPQSDDEADIIYHHRIRFCIDVIFGDPDKYLSAFVDGLIWNSTGVPGMVDIMAASADLTATGDAQIQAAVNAVFNFMIGIWWA